MDKVVKKVYNIYYDVIYKYSHKKLFKIMEQPSFRAIFTHFVESGTLDALLENDKTMKINMDVYKARTNEILRKSNQ